MAKYKLTQDVARAKKFRHNGRDYYPTQVTQKELKELYKIGFQHVKEIKSTQKNEEIEENNAND
jgi:hypothetical protein|tara:strand:+ start:294 stop:485 length:192 start_codon:yes stop_codon:yes gene_type:complete